MTLLQLGVAALATIWLSAILIVGFLLIRTFKKDNKSQAPGPDEDFYDEESREPDLKAIEEIDSNSKQNKENLYEMESDLPVFISKCCKVPTHKPKQGAAKCSKCNKFTKLI